MDTEAAEKHDDAPWAEFAWNMRAERWVRDELAEIAQEGLRLQEEWHEIRDSGRVTTSEASMDGGAISLSFGLTPEFGAHVARFEDLYARRKALGESVRAPEPDIPSALSDVYTLGEWKDWLPSLVERLTTEGGDWNFVNLLAESGYVGIASAKGALRALVSTNAGDGTEVSTSVERRLIELGFLLVNDSPQTFDQEVELEPLGPEVIAQLVRDALTLAYGAPEASTIRVEGSLNG